MRVNISGAKLKPARTHTCVIFNARDGQIRHMHTVTTLGRIRPKSQEEVEKEAYSLAKQSARDVSNTKTLHLTGIELNPLVTYRVDLKTASLIEEAGIYQEGLRRGKAPKRERSGK